MAKNEAFRTTTTLSLNGIRSAMTAVLRSAEVSTADEDPLRGPTAMSFVATQAHAPFKKPKFGAGLAAVRVDVTDEESQRVVDITAFGTSMGAHVSGAMAVRHESFTDRAAVVRTMPNPRSSKHMAEALIQALR